jgi:hypothetical protein
MESMNQHIKTAYEPHKEVISNHELDAPPSGLAAQVQNPGRRARCCGQGRIAEEFPEDGLPFEAVF